MSDAWMEATRALARGELGAVREAYETARVHDDEDRVRWAVALVEAGALDEAKALLDEVEDPSRRAAVDELMALERPGPRTDQDDEDEEADRLEVRRTEVRPDEALVQSFLRWFGGRPDLYARQWYDARRRRGGYRPVREPVDADVVRAHLAGRQTMGQYLLWPDATVSFAVIDLDLDASALAELEAAHGPGSAVRHPGLRGYARQVLERAQRLGVPMAASDSGRRGIHLWLFFQPRRPAKAARALLARIVEGAGPPPAEVSVEIFPKQDRHGARGLSSLVKLPLGLHQATMERCPLLDEHLQPVREPRDALLALKPVPPSRIDDIVGRRLVALPPHDASERAPALPDGAGSPRSLAEALRQVEDGKPARAAALRMIDGCAVLSSLVDRAYRDRRLSADEARAVVYSLGLVGREPRLAMEILRAAEAPMRELHRVRRGLPSPVGCRRLRELGAAAGVRCQGCPDKGAADPYPTPALFAVGVVPATPSRHAPFASWLEAADALEEDAYEQLTNRLERLDERLRALEADTERE